MNTYVKVIFAVGVPMMVLLGMTDLAATFYRPDPAGELGYQVVEPEDVEEEVVEEEAPVEEAAVEEVIEEEAPVEEAAVEEEPATEEVADAAAEEEAETAEAPAEDAPAEDSAATDETVAEDEATEEAVDFAEAAEGTTEEEVAASEDAAAPMMIALSDDEMRQAERAMRKCTTCHQLERERNLAGPHLVGVIGRQIGSVDGFRYSDALTALGDAGEAWNVENLQAWIENPSAFADGSRMNFKVGDADERRLIAGWLAAQ